MRLVVMADLALSRTRRLSAGLAAVSGARLRKHFGTAFWSSLHALSGAARACTQRCDAGFEPACVSALAVAFEASPLTNLRALCFPIERVYATPNGGCHRGTKADTIKGLSAQAFVNPCSRTPLPRQF